MLMAPSFDMEKAAAENSTPYSKWWPWGKTPQGIVHLQAVNAHVQGLHYVDKIFFNLQPPYIPSSLPLDWLKTKAGKYDWLKFESFVSDWPLANLIVS